MPINQTFTDALMQLRRKAQLQGRPLTQQETAGAVEGMAMSASDRLAKGRQLDLEQQRVDLAGKSLQEQMLRNQQQLDIANKMMRRQKYENLATTGMIALAEAPKIVKGAQTIFNLVKGIF